MLKGEHSAILSTFNKLPFVIKIFVFFFEWLLKTCFTVLTTYTYFPFCGAHRLAVRWISLLNWDFFTTKKDGSTGHTALESDGPYFEVMGQRPGPIINWRPACSLYFSINSAMLNTEKHIPHAWIQFVCLFDLILYVPSTIFQLNRDGSSWVKPVLS